MKRPLLPVWYIIKDNILIKMRICSIYHSEIYELTNEQFLYLYLELSIWKILKQKLDKFDHIILQIGWKEYIGILASKNSTENILKYKRELTELIWFEKIAWMAWLKQLLTEEVINPFRYPEKYEKYKLGIPNWILFFGPPWCWKTYITRRLAEELWYEFLEIKHSDIWSPYIHWSVGKIAGIFQEAKKKAPCIVFIDELSALVPKRENLDSTSQYREEEIGEILMHLNDASKNKILVIWATNFPDRIDTAVQRSWRIDKKIYIWPPDEEARVELFKMYLDWRPLSTDIDFIELSKLTDNFVTSDIELIVEEVARKGFKMDKEISMSLFLGVLKDFRPSVWMNELQFFQQKDTENRKKIGFNVE